MKHKVDSDQTDRQREAFILKGDNMAGTYCSFRSVNCFSRVVISSRHSILLRSQSSSSISVHMKTWQVWQHLHILHFQPPTSTTNTRAYTHLHPVNQPSCQLIKTETAHHDEPQAYRGVNMLNLALGWCFRPVFPTRAVSIFRHGGANSVLLVCAAAVLLGKIHLHFFVVAFLLLPGVNRHGGFQINR